MAFIPGTPASEVLIGTPEDDQIAGFEGDDLLTVKFIGISRNLDF